MNTLKLSKDGLTVIDERTGLTYQQSGSANYMNYAEAEEYVRELNTKRFAGYNDWRLPTRDEAMSILLLQPVNNFYADPVFDRQQTWIWTADKESAGRAWCVDFHVGYCGHVVIGGNWLVRAVRSGQSAL